MLTHTSPPTFTVTTPRVSPILAKSSRLGLGRLDADWNLKFDVEALISEIPRREGHHDQKGRHRVFDVEVVPQGVKDRLNQLDFIGRDLTEYQSEERVS